MPAEASNRVVLRRENEGFRSRDDSGSGRVSDRVPGRLPEVLRRAFGTSGVVEKLSKLTDSVFSRGETRIRLTLNLSGSRTFRETTREGGAILEGTVQNSLFSHENIKKSCRFVVNSGIIKGVLFGFR